jgi:hypothetical protein
LQFRCLKTLIARRTPNGSVGAFSGCEEFDSWIIPAIQLGAQREVRIPTQGNFIGVRPQQFDRPIDPGTQPS